MKLTDYVVQYFEKQKITHVFGFQGGLIANMIDSCSKSDSIKYIQCYHEQTAAIAAEGYARETGKFGVALASSGPGATNLITGIANAYFDSIPVIYITGNVNTFEGRCKRKIRQLSCQETDIVSIVKYITKYATIINNPQIIKYELEKAIAVAMSGRKGPVLLDIPNDIQRSEIDLNKLVRYNETFQEKKVQEKKVQDICNILKNSKRPMVICGGGLQSNIKLQELVHVFLKKTKLPFVVSLMGKGSVDETLDNFCGMIGSYANRCANIVFSNADVVLALGTRLDARQTGNRKNDTFEKIRFIQVDVDPEVLKDNSIKNKIAINCDISVFLKHPEIQQLSIRSRQDWTSYVQSMKQNYSHDVELEHNFFKKEPYLAMKKISNNATNNTVFVVDIGQNQQWAAQMLKLQKNQRFFTAGGFAPMGYAIPTAIGIAFANPKRHIICIVGDGGFQISLQALLLISQYNLNITVVVLNNHCLGLISQFQIAYFNSNMPGTVKECGYDVPDIKYIAKAVRLKYYYINNISEDCLPKLSGGRLIEINLPELTSVVPKLEFNQPLYNMTPYLKEDEINEILSFHKAGLITNSNSMH
ncbi:MAG: thiamine pyrophosphate-binding protein [Endomicrobium sp.]|jgi:acetolactate synthase-1/2/3 large subunit|nr:thiamine pyrophosphate-binding protein [Endomicrobium sp.]